MRLVGRGAQIEQPAGIGRRRRNGFEVASGGFRTTGRRLGTGLDERPATHSAEFVIARIFVSAIGAAQNIPFELSYERSLSAQSMTCRAPKGGRRDALRSIDCFANGSTPQTRLR